MTRIGKAVRAAGLAAMVSVVISCGARDYPGAALHALPENAVGAVSLGPLALEASDLFNENRSLVFLFDADGDVVGRIEGHDITGSRTLASSRNLVTVSARAVTTLTATSRAEFGIDESWVEAAANDPASGAATVWFSRRDSTFVTVAADGRARSGTVPGRVEAAAQCGERAVAIAIAIAIEAVPADDGLYTSRLFEVGPGGEPVERGVWRQDPEFSAASSTAVCTADGRSMLSLHRSPGPADGGEPEMTLVRTNLVDGSRTASPLEMSGHSPTTRGGSLTIVGDRLYWITLTGDVLSTPVTGWPSVAREWSIPGSGEKSAATVHGATVSTLDHAQRPPTFAQYDLVTGARTAGPVELPWLGPLIDAETESGNNVYGVTDLDGLGR
ncbi:hypothetical protein [Rhodococcus sp. NPDC127528]|uniref:hypothetical protein n=1 Tax=unclassified Rhodococcus (in: high G+C Gram-positive bacteria) TaxID=192944 RepID=UPI00362FAC6D